MPEAPPSPVAAVVEAPVAGRAPTSERAPSKGAGKRAAGAFAAWQQQLGNSMVGALLGELIKPDAAAGGQGAAEAPAGEASESAAGPTGAAAAAKAPAEAPAGEAPAGEASESAAGPTGEAAAGEAPPEPAAGTAPGADVPSTAAGPSGAEPTNAVALGRDRARQSPTALANAAADGDKKALTSGPTPEPPRVERTIETQQVERTIEARHLERTIEAVGGTGEPKPGQAPRGDRIQRPKAERAIESATVERIGKASPTGGERTEPKPEPGVEPLLGPKPKPTPTTEEPGAEGQVPRAPEAGRAPAAAVIDLDAPVTEPGPTAPTTPTAPTAPTAAGIAPRAPVPVAPPGPAAADGEQTTPGFEERRPANPPAPRRPRRPAGGAGPAAGPRAKPKVKAVPKPSLGDPKLDKWKAAVGGGTGAVATTPIDTEAGAKNVADAGKTQVEGRAGKTQGVAEEAASKQPPLPQEAPKEKTLDTGPAEAALAEIEAAGSAKLPDQSLAPAPTPPPYTAVPLTPADFVPKNLRDDAASIEAQLAAEKDPGKRAELDAKLKRVKERIAGIEATAGKGAADVATVIHDEGAAKLTPPDPAMGDVLGDAIARAMGSINPTAKSTVDRAVGAAHGDKVPDMLAMGETERPKLEQELGDELKGIAAAAGVSEKALQAKIVEQQKIVADQADAANKNVDQQAKVASEARGEQAKEESAQTDGAKVAVEQTIADKQAAASGPPDTAAIEAKRDELLRKAETMIATAGAALRAAYEKRLTALDQAGNEKKGKVSAAANTQAAAIRRHWANDTDPNKGMVEARPTTEWSATQQGEITREVQRLKDATTAENTRLAGAVTDKAQPTKDKIRDWAAHQEGRERGFWERLLDMFRDWGSQATRDNEAWAAQRNAETRDSMTADLNTLTALRSAQMEGNAQGAQEAFAKLSTEQRALLDKYMAPGKVDAIGFVAESTMLRIGARRAGELAKSFEERAIAEWTWEPLGQLARATNPGFQPKVLANKIHGGVDGWGTNEAKVYEGLGGARSAVERAALSKCYQATFGSSMESDIRGDMEDEELDRAEALMSGNAAMAEAAAIAEAVDGLGTDEDAIRTALRGKTKDELEAIKKAYRDKYGKELAADLRDDMGGAELDNALALADGDVDKADAAELEDAMSGPGTNEEKMTKVMERIREEEQQYALSHGLTKAELDKRIKDRNGRVSAQYAALGYGDLKANARDELSDGDPLSQKNADNKLFDALMEGDPDKADAAKLLVEKEGVYTSDDEVEAITRNQRKKAEFDVNLEDAAAKAKLNAEASSNDVSKADYDRRLKELDPKDPANKERKEARIASKAKDNITALKGNFEEMANTETSVALHGKVTFDDFIEDSTSGYSNAEINALLNNGGKLSPEDEIYFAVAGVGTSEEQLKEALKDKTPEEIKKIREEYERKHGKGSFDSDILGDLSGRENLDIGLQLQYGDPSTFADQLAAAKDPAERKKLLAGYEEYLTKRRDFEETGSIGAMMSLTGDSMNSADQLADAVDRAKAYDAALTSAEGKPGFDRSKLDDDPALVAAKANFDMNFQGAVQAQEEVREQIDAYTDIAAQVGAAVVGIAVTVATFGTAGPAVAALYGALASAMASMQLKMSMKGAAYGWEDMGIDAAVGVVDALVSAATAGVGKGLTTAVEGALLRQAAKTVAKEGVEQATIRTLLREAVEEAIEGGLQAMPSAFVQGVLNGQKPEDAVGGALMAGAQGAAMSVGMKGVTEGGGAALGAIKGKAKAEPHLETKGPHVEGPPKLDEGLPPTELPAAKETNLPPAADAPAAVADIEAGKPPPAAAGHEPQARAAAEADPLAKPEPATKAEPAAKPDPATKAEPGAKAEPEAKAEPRSPEPGKAPEAPTREAAAREGKGPSPDDAGKSLSPEVLAERYGMPAENVAKIEQIAAAHDVIIDIRPTTPYAEPMLREGKALPKPEAIKAKTINETDVMLGLGSKDSLGKVGFFDIRKMQLPEGFEQLDHAMQDKLLSRLKQRQEEFHHYHEAMGKLVAEGKIRIEPDGTIVNTGLLQGKGELPFTGDHDLYSIRQSDGRPVDPDTYKKVVKELREADCGVMHGAADNWKIDEPGTFDVGASNKMEANHSQGGSEPLIRIGKGEPHATWHEPYEVPEGTLYLANSLAEARDPVANRAHFDKIVALEPDTEVALLQNPLTGSHVVMQGNRGMVPTSSIYDLAGEGPWVVIAHNHPVGTDGLTPTLGRFPSGEGGDLGVLAQQSKMLDGAAQQAEIQVITENGPEVRRYGFDPAEEKPYWVEIPDKNGALVKERFASPAEYDQRLDEMFPDRPKLEPSAETQTPTGKRQSGEPRAPGGSEQAVDKPGSADVAEVERLRHHADKLDELAGDHLQGHPDADMIAKRFAEIDKMLDAGDVAAAKTAISDLERQLERSMVHAGQAGGAIDTAELDAFIHREVWVPPSGSPPRPPATASTRTRQAWLRERLEMHVADARQRYATEGMRPGQEAAAAERPGMEPAFRGSRIDEFAKESVMCDPELYDLIAAPDFVNEPDLLSASLPTWFDMTTRNEWQNHLDRYRQRYGRSARLLDTNQ